MLSHRAEGFLLAMAQRQAAQGADGCWQAPLGCLWVERGGSYQGVLSLSRWSPGLER